jgi:hypothetical protein
MSSRSRGWYTDKWQPPVICDKTRRIALLISLEWIIMTMISEAHTHL